MKLHTSFILVSAALASLSASARAQMIAVPNFDFATNPGHNAVADVNQDANAIQYFTETNTGPGHYGNAGVPAPDGSTSGFVNTDNSGTITLVNDLTAGGTNNAPTFTTGMVYTLSLEVGINPTNQNTNYDRTGNVTFGLLSGGNVVGTQTFVPAGAIVPNVVNGSPVPTFETFTFTYDATAADNGQAIGIQINDQFDAGSQTEFSHLQLSAGAAPEPGTWAMMLGGMGLLAFATRLRGVLKA